MKFTDLNLSEDIQSAVVAAGFEKPSPIQELTIPLALEGKDVIGQAQTGTGKTAAFGLPTLDKIRTEENYKNDEREGLAKAYDENGKLVQQATFKNGKQVK